MSGQLFRIFFWIRKVFCKINKFCLGPECQRKDLIIGIRASNFDFERCYDVSFGRMDGGRAGEGEISEGKKDIWKDLHIAEEIEGMQWGTKNWKWKMWNNF